MAVATVVRRHGPLHKPQSSPQPPLPPADLLDGLLTCPLPDCGWTVPDPATLPLANRCYPDALPPAAAATVTHLSSHAYQVRTAGVVPLALRGPYARMLEAQQQRIYTAARQLRAARRAPPTLAERAAVVLTAERARRAPVLPEGDM